MNKSFRETQTVQELLKLLDDPNPQNRQAAIDTLVGQGNKSIVQRLLEKAEHDPSIAVRHAAFRGLQIITAKQFDAEIEQWQAWWKEDKENWPPKD
jgi:HEAT repeat protein